MLSVACHAFDVRTADVPANLAAARAALGEARAAGVRLLVLPEMWPSSFAPAPDPDLRAASDAAVEALHRDALAAGVVVAGSAWGSLDGQELPVNRLQLLGLDPAGPVLVHDKVHLFTPTAEHLAFGRGSLPPRVVELDGVRVSGLVCYDLRFPEVPRAAVRAGAEVLVVCAQWPTPRATHWTALLDGRAVEAQAHVVAANRSGRALVGRRRMELEFPGNGRVVAPTGEVLAAGTGEGAVRAELDLGAVRELRRRVPVLEDERRALLARWTAGEDGTDRG